MNEIASHALAFLIGAATGAAGEYFAELFTDRRRKKEALKEESALFQRMIKQLPDLLKEMRTDVLEQPSWREFFIVERGIAFWQPEGTYRYENDVANSYLNKTRVLEANGYVNDVTEKDVPKFRMREDFVTRLRDWDGS